MGLIKAELVNIDANTKIKCMFNPTEIKLQKSNTWQTNSRGGRSAPRLNFQGGGPISMQLQLFFDTYREAQNGKADDVRKITDEVWKLMKVDQDRTHRETRNGRPPFVRLEWGTNITTFKGAIKSISQTFNLFMPDGTPVRATLDLTIEQVADEGDMPMQNPTSGGIGGERVWLVHGGDTLAWIAHKELGDATQWRRIAEANRLTRVRELKVGQMLMIPVD